MEFRRPIPGGHSSGAETDGLQRMPRIASRQRTNGTPRWELLGVSLITGCDKSGRVGVAALGNPINRIGN
jgi:hypothetical protein